jgi:hypothetical protein
MEEDITSSLGLSVKSADELPPDQVLEAISRIGQREDQQKQPTQRPQKSPKPPSNAPSKSSTPPPFSSRIQREESNPLVPHVEKPQYLVWIQRIGLVALAMLAGYGMYNVLSGIFLKIFPGIPPVNPQSLVDESREFYKTGNRQT